jgi:hypothetical protein
VRGTQLANAMKKMDIEEIRPREMIEVEDDKDQVLSNSNVQVDTNQASSSSQPSDQSNTINQVQVLQPINVARDHPLDSIIGDISRGVQTRSRVASFCEQYSLSHLLNLRR